MGAVRERELEKDAWGDRWRFWARVNGSKVARDRIQQICGNDGRVLVGVEIRDRWKEHFQRGVRMLMGRKVAGMCGIMLEMLKTGGEVVVQWLTEFFNMVWRVGVEECSHCPHT